MESGPYSHEGLLRLLVDAFRGHDDEPPSPAVEFLTSVDVAVVLARIVRVLPTVVLDHQPKMRVAQVESA
jgi:hypothetical protein